MPNEAVPNLPGVASPVPSGPPGGSPQPGGAGAAVPNPLDYATNRRPLVRSKQARGMPEDEWIGQMARMWLKTQRELWPELGRRGAPVGRGRGDRHDGGGV